MGHNSFVYRNDGFGSQPERTSAFAAAFIQRKDLVSYGHWVLILVGDWLGLVINIGHLKIPRFSRTGRASAILNS